MLAAVYVPGSPYEDIGAVLHKIETAPQSEATWDHFLAVGERTRWLSATLGAAVAAIISGIALSFLRPRILEIVAATATYVSLNLGGSSLCCPGTYIPELVGLVVFAGGLVLTLYVSMKLRNRHASAA